MPEPEVSYFPARDRVRLAYHELGEGRPLLLLHGIAGDASLWLRYGHAEALAACGHRVIMPDFRGHGSSAKPHDPAAYPSDILTDDALALVDHLGLAQRGYDLAGYSLGARIVVRMLIRGATPARAVVAGQGLREVQGTGGGAGAVLRRVCAGFGTFTPGSPEARTEEYLRAAGVDPEALPHVLDSIADTPLEPLQHIRTPTLVAIGADDERAASADALVAALPHATRATLPGDHGSAATAPELAAAIADFLSTPAVPSA
jgi:pimeloyl-ACP methyl ester carboxylesterase